MPDNNKQWLTVMMSMREARRGTNLEEKEVTMTEGEMIEEETGIMTGLIYLLPSSTVNFVKAK